MNHPMVLLYNLDNPKGAKIRRMALPLGLRTRLVTPAEYGLTLGALAEGEAPETPWTGRASGTSCSCWSTAPAPCWTASSRASGAIKFPRWP